MCVCVCVCVWGGGGGGGGLIHGWILYVSILVGLYTGVIYTEGGGGGLIYGFLRYLRCQEVEKEWISRNEFSEKMIIPHQYNGKLKNNIIFNAFFPVYKDASIQVDQG